MDAQGYNFYSHVCTLLSQNSSSTWGQFKAITVTTVTGRGVTIFWSPQTMVLLMTTWIQKFLLLWCLMPLSGHGLPSCWGFEATEC